MNALIDTYPIIEEYIIVDEWRRSSFEKLLPGFSERTIQKLVESYHVSPHDFEKLFEAGCDPKTAVRILI